MKTVLIIYAHWHPANLAGVHRSRLIGNYLNDFGWKPRIVTVDSKYYEEAPDPDFEKTFSKAFEVTRVKALRVKRPRIIGDIGLRGFFYLYKEALRIIRTEKIDFLWIPIPSFYMANMGRLLYAKTGIPYGIDYIDPWVRNLTNQRNVRAVVSQWAARLMEPFALKKASLVSGVSEAYYEPVLQRNFPLFFQPDGSLKHSIINPSTGKKLLHCAMPYGFDPNDHNIVLDGVRYPWNDYPDKKHWVYAGAFLPNSHIIMKAMLHAISNMKQKGGWDENVMLWFVGTGMYPAKTIASYAADLQLSDTVKEVRDRFPFLKVLHFLSAAHTVMIIGSTEKHYTASKTFQSLLSQRPVLAAFHHQSSACEMMESCQADNYLVKYLENMTHHDLVAQFEVVLLKRLTSNDWNPQLASLNQYSSRESAKVLAEAMEMALNE